jgi:chromosome segregation ATPase
MKNEIDYINKEQEKFRSQSYAEKVEKFKDYIEDSNRKTQKMREDLDALKREWDQKLERAAQRTESLLGSAVKGGKLEELAAELRAKQSELSVLQSRRAELERQIKNADSSRKEAEIRELREGLKDLNKQFLEILEEKNRMFEDLTTQTKELLTLNGQIQTYA